MEVTAEAHETSKHVSRGQGNSVEADTAATVVRCGEFGIVERNATDNHANAPSHDKSADKKHRDPERCCHKGTTNDANDTCYLNRAQSSQLLRGVGSRERSQTEFSS